MSGLSIGEVAPEFRLPSGQGPEIGPGDYKGRSNLIVWFTKGMGCPFCRAQMSHLARGYPEYRSLNTEILEITPTEPRRARFYADRYKLPFPYLSDPDHTVWNSWGLEIREHPVEWYFKARDYAVTNWTLPPPNQFSEAEPTLNEFAGIITDSDVGFFILDKAGVVRYSLGEAYATAGGVRQIPTHDEIVRELKRCEEASRA
jgi:peroxiredoxin